MDSQMGFVGLGVKFYPPDFGTPGYGSCTDGSKREAGL